MKQRDLVRHLEKHGCEFLREGGNHTVYVNRKAMPMVLKTWDGVAVLPALLVPANVGGTKPKSPTLAISFLWPAFEVLLAGRFHFASIRVVAQTIFLQAVCEPVLRRVVSFEHSRTF